MSDSTADGTLTLECLKYQVYAGSIMTRNMNLVCGRKHGGISVATSPSAVFRHFLMPTTGDISSVSTAGLPIRSQDANNTTE